MAGGGTRLTSHNGPLASAELYDPGSGSWTATRNMVTPHSEHTATLLSDGKVLVAGSSESLAPLASASAELYHPGSGN